MTEVIDPGCQARYDSGSREHISFPTERQSEALHTDLKVNDDELLLAGAIENGHLGLPWWHDAPTLLWDAELVCAFRSSRIEHAFGPRVKSRNIDLTLYEGDAPFRRGRIAFVFAAGDRRDKQ